ncbi:MAG: hypothetical protein ACO3NK_08240 [Prochlorotrichaceae cyanobacterium]
MGNSAYETISPLQNPVNDAQGMTQALTDVGFDRVITMPISKRCDRRWTTLLPMPHLLPLARPLLLPS